MHHRYLRSTGCMLWEKMRFESREDHGYPSRQSQIFRISATWLRGFTSVEASSARSKGHGGTSDGAMTETSQALDNKPLGELLMFRYLRDIYLHTAIQTSNRATSGSQYISPSQVIAS